MRFFSALPSFTTARHREPHILRPYSTYNVIFLHFTEYYAESFLLYLPQFIYFMPRISPTMQLFNQKYGTAAFLTDIKARLHCNSLDF